MRFGVSEYTLVFRRELATSQGKGRQQWQIVRPVLGFRTEGSMGATRTLHHDGGRETQDVAQVFVVPVCSTLALDGIAYEKFLLQSGVLDEIVRYLGRQALTTAHAVETARKQAQALVMGAEVQHIVDGMSA